MIDGQSLWNQVKEYTKNNTETQSYYDMISDINDIFNVSNNDIYLLLENSLDKFRLEKYFLSKLNDTLHLFNKEANLKLLSKEEIIKSDLPQKTINQQTLINIKKRNLKSDYTFENFVTGEANNEAFVYATKIATSDAVTINPFYIFGNVGLGKTHLMSAIGHKILDRNQNLNLIYTTGQQFVEDYINAKNKNQKDVTISNEFDEYYRNADILLVDDIQYLESKTGSQDEFFKLFDFLFENNKQIVITSDKPANELNMMSRLKSRFAWGIQADIKQPNLSLRFNIVKSKLSQLLSNSSDVPDDVINYIAINFDSNIRDLEGATKRFVNYCVSFNFPFDIDTAIACLKPILPKNRTNTNEDDKEAYAQQLLEKVSKYFNISIKDLTSQTRKKQLVYARDLMVYILKEKYSFTLDGIGAVLGNRDHSTIAHSYNKMVELLQNDINIKEDVNNLIKFLEKK